MEIVLLRAKLHGATVTEANLEYEGSITIDRDLMDAVGLLDYERVQVVNLNNGERLETYTIPGERGSGVICMNGPAALRCDVGDRIHILAYAWLHTDETEGFEPKRLKLGDGNKPRSENGD